MTKIEKLSKYESKIRPFINRIGLSKTISFYSNQKKKFIKNFADDHFHFDPVMFDSKSVILWDIKFNLPIFNAAGMFKHAESYYTVAKQGAGAWLSGTSTGLARAGNFKDGILHPFLPFPKSESAINWMGLPNQGHLSNAKRISKINKIANCPIGASLSYDSGIDNLEAMDLMIEGLIAFSKAGVDFIEINESCPNVEEGHSLSNDSLDPSLIQRIETLNDRYLKTTTNKIPVIIKLSNDTDPELIQPVIDLLINNNFAGINLGNTSSKYQQRRELFNEKEAKQLDYFSSKFGGGISGNPVKNDSFNLSALAARYVDKKHLQTEFNIIRTGGITNAADINASRKENVKLFQWYTGYFSNFSKFGHNLYNELNKQL
ncbi:hypothetical protein OAQ99_04385 [Candidatus Kapabacteria bacterium]|nr:hypothetical protein [Candidatus Kapabacteria bacterium]